MRTPYPFSGHCLSLVPVVFLLCCIRAFIGTEQEVFAYFTGLRAAYPWLTALVAALSHGILFLFYPVYAFFLYRGLRGKKKEDVFFVFSFFVAQVLVAALLCRVIKISVGRPRPMTGGPFVPFSFGWGYQSFPSGHVGEAVGSSLPLLWRFGCRGKYLLQLGLGFVVAIVAFTRLYLGMHHPTDIWGGLVLGSISGYVSWKLYGWLEQHWRRFLPKLLRDWLNMA